MNVVTLLSSVVVDFAAQVNNNFARFIMFNVGAGIADGIETIEYYCFEYKYSAIRNRLS